MAAKWVGGLLGTAENLNLRSAMEVLCSQKPELGLANSLNHEEA